MFKMTSFGFIIVVLTFIFFIVFSLCFNIGNIFNFPLKLLISLRQTFYWH